LNSYSAYGGQWDYIIIKSKDMDNSVDVWKRDIEKVTGMVRARELDYETEEAKEWIEKLGIKTIPYVIFDKKITENKAFFDLVRKGMIDKRMEEYIIPDNQIGHGSLMFFQRDRRPDQLDLFINSQYPERKDAIMQLSNYLEKHPGGLRLICHYVDSFTDAVNQNENTKDSIYSLIIQKYYPDKFWGYLKKRSEGKDFWISVSESGINADDVINRQGEGAVLLEQDLSLCKELNIKSAPVYLWENRVILSSLGWLRDLIRHKQGISQEPISSQGPITISLFFRPDCGSCKWMINEYIPKLKEDFGERVAFEYYDINIQENFEKKLKIEEELGVIGGGKTIPEVVFSGRVLIGRREIEQELDKTIREMTGIPPSISSSVANDRPDSKKPGSILIERFKSFTPFAVAGAGFLDGVSACVFSAIVFFICFLVFTGFSDRQMIIAGLSFIAAVFITHTGLGLGVLTGLERVRSFSSWFNNTVGGAAIILGLGNLYDYAQIHRGVSFKPLNRVKGIMRQTSGFLKDGRLWAIKIIAVAFIAGSLVSLFESMCTGQIYLPTIIFILKMKVMQWRAFLFLLLYNLMFILPLLAVFLVWLYSARSKWGLMMSQGNLAKAKLLTAMFFFVIGIFIILL